MIDNPIVKPLATLAESGPLQLMATGTVQYLAGAESVPPCRWLGSVLSPACEAEARRLGVRDDLMVLRAVWLDMDHPDERRSGR